MTVTDKPDIPEGCNPFAHDFDPNSHVWQSHTWDERKLYAWTAQKWMLDNDAPFLSQGVFPTSDDGYHFVYTIGRSRRTRPEYIMTGNSSWGSGSFKVLDERDWNEPGIYRMYDGNPLAQVALLPVEPSHVDGHFGQALDHSMTLAPLQVTIMDDEGNWLWEPDHYAYNESTMPLLGKPCTEVHV